jgi:hypothetical protein
MQKRKLREGCKEKKVAFVTVPWLQASTNLTLIPKGDASMRRIACFLAVAMACGLLLISAGQLRAADETANAAGTWEMTSEGPNGPMTQTLTIQQDGSKIKGTLTGRRGDMPFEGTVAGNKISFTIKRDTPNGTFTIEYSATIDGDSMKGTAHSERFDREWTAKRTK